MQFDAQRTLASIGFLVKKTDADLYSIMKMLYLADKEHLGLFGRTITGDKYVAMQKGPVPDRAYEMCKFLRGDRDFFDPMPTARDFMRLKPAPTHEFKLLADPDVDQLSQSDLQCLEFAAGIFLEKREWKSVADASHDEAWKEAWAEAKSRGAGSIAMRFTSIAATLPNAAVVIEHLNDPHPGQASPSRAQIES